jgi:TPM domain
MLVHCRVEVQLDRLTAAFESPCGNTHEPVEAGVALVQRMALQKGTTPNDQASNFAEHLHNAWGIGHPGCSNGLLLLLSLEDRAFAFSVGEGLDSILTQQRRQAVLDSMKPALRAGDTAGGIEAALRKVHDIFSKHLPAAAPHLGRQPSAAASKKSAADKPAAKQGDANSSSSGGSGGSGDSRFTGTVQQPKKSAFSSLKQAGHFLEKQALWLLLTGVLGVVAHDVLRKHEITDFVQRMAHSDHSLASGLSGGATAAAAAAVKMCPICQQEFKAGEAPAHSANATKCTHIGCDGEQALQLGCGHALL